MKDDAEQKCKCYKCNAVVKLIVDKGQEKCSACGSTLVRRIRE